MGRRRRITIGFTLAAGLFLVGCAKREEPQAAPVVDAGAKKPTPVDHLAPGELVEGNEKVFALALPRVMHVDRAFDDSAYVSGPAAPEAVTKYIEARVRDGKVTENREGHLFENVRVPGESRLLEIIVEKNPAGSGTRVRLRDVTPPPPPKDQPADEEGRWRAVGLKPNGEPLDRTKLH